MKAAEEATRGYWRLGAILHHVVGRELYRELGYAKFADYVVRGLGMSLRRARYLVAIREEFAGFLDEERAAKIGWTKLAVLLPLAPADRFAMLEGIEGRSLDELERAARGAFIDDTASEDEDPAGAGRQVPFRALVAASALRDIVEPALEIAARICEYDSTTGRVGWLLELVCADFINTHLHEVQAGDTLANKRLAERLERAATRLRELEHLR